MKRVIALLMENQPGALSRVVGLFSQRGYNIESLIVAPTEDPSLSRLTMTTHGDSQVVEQITKQLNKLMRKIKETKIAVRYFFITFFKWLIISFSFLLIFALIIYITFKVISLFS